MSPIADWVSRADSTQPRFVDLPPVHGCPELRWVGSTMMGREEYALCGWHIVAVSDAGVQVWGAELDGLRRYDRAVTARRLERREAGRRRREDDESWRAHVDALDDAKPAGYVR
jgi:hypothetical protein